MVDPQSPLPDISNHLGTHLRAIPEVGDDLIATVRLGLVLLRGTLGNLESILWEDGVARIGTSTNFATIQTMAEDLDRL